MKVKRGCLTCCRGETSNSNMEEGSAPCDGMTHSKAPPNKPSSQETSSGGGPKCQEAIGDTVAHSRSERVSKISNDPLLVGVNTPRSGEDSLKLTELMELCTKLQQRVLDLETTKTTQAMEIESLKRRVKKLERRKRSRTHELKRLYKVGMSTRVESSKDKGLGEEDASKQERIANIDANEYITLVSIHDEQMFDTDQDLGATLAQALAELKHVKPKAKAKGIVFHEPEESTTTTTTTIPKPRSHDKGKAKMIEEPMKLKKKDQIQLDEELVLKLQAELQAEFDKEQRLAAERAQQEEVVCLMLASMSPDLQKTLENFNAFDMLQELAKQELFEIVKALHACKQEDGQSAATHVIHSLRGGKIQKDKNKLGGAKGSGYGTHMYNTAQGHRRSRKLKHRALSLYVGNGMRVAMEAIGSFDLILLGGLNIILDNCHYAPSITMGVVLLYHLVEYGYIHTFMNYDLEIIQEENTQPSKNTSEQNNKVVHNDVDRYSEIVPICRSNKIAQAPDRYGFYVDAEEHELGDLNEPSNYKARLLDPESDKWVVGNTQRVIGRTSKNVGNTQTLKCYNCNGRGINITEEETNFLADIRSDEEHKDLNATCIMMARILEGKSNSTAPSYDSDGLSEIIMAKVIPLDHVDDVPVVEPNQPDAILFILESVLVDKDEDPKEEEFKEEEEPQEEEEDMEVDIEEDENEPELTYPYEEVDPLNPLPPASDSEPEDVIEVEDMVEPKDETIPASVHETTVWSRDDTCMVKTKGKSKDDYGKLILDLGNEVRSSMEEGVAAMENLVRKLGNAEERAGCKKLKKELKEVRFSHILLYIQKERVERDLYWTRVRAHEFFQDMIRWGFVFEERPNEAIDVSVKDEESPSSELRGSFRNS
uniref:Zinc finger, CCHC-type n=1 Tax=Tanacetum cinerariifolium TaxID=118510 RepID=A0A699GPN4_TANCI|nr:zinc finger, CCHC-type [Tanacetum cinerariifolium]